MSSLPGVLILPSANYKQECLGPPGAAPIPLMVSFTRMSQIKSQAQLWPLGCEQKWCGTRPGKLRSGGALAILSFPLHQLQANSKAPGKGGSICSKVPESLHHSMEKTVHYPETSTLDSYMREKYISIVWSPWNTGICYVTLTHHDNILYIKLQIHFPEDTLWKCRSHMSMLSWCVRVT